MKNPFCSDCKIETKPVITTFAQMYEPMAIYDDPKAGVPYWTGEYYCPKCRRIIYPEVKK